MVIGYSAAMATLREAARLDAAEALAQPALQRFPEEPAVHNEQAWLIAARRRKLEAIARWASIRDRFPKEWVPYLDGARSRREAGDGAGAEVLPQAGADKFPTEPILLTELASLASIRSDRPAAIHWWEQVGTRFPGLRVGYTSSAQVLRSAQRFDEAETLLVRAASLFPNETAPATELAWLAHIKRDFDVAVRRWDAVRVRFPDLLSGYLDVVHPLRGLKRVADAERILIQAVFRIPNDFAPAAELASMAAVRCDWAQAEGLYAILRDRFPGQIGSYSGSDRPEFDGKGNCRPARRNASIRQQHDVIHSLRG